MTEEEVEEKWIALKEQFGAEDEEDEDEKELWQTVARGLKAAVELGKLDEDEAKEIWQEMTEGDDDDR